MTIEAEIKKDKMHVFRRLYFKRRLSGGDYETDWQQIPGRYVKGWGTISFNVDDAIPNFVRQGSLNLSLNNDDGFFSDVSEEKSFFFTAITRYRTLVKIEAGYTAEDGTEFPTNPSLFVGIITKDAKYKENNLVNFSVMPLTQIFEEFPADRLKGLTDSMTASEILTNIRDHQQTATTTSYIFQKYISTGGWSFSTSSINYNFETSTTLEGKTTWKLIQDMAAAEGKVAYVDRLGDFYFAPRTASGTASYHFSGIGDREKTYGHNIIGGIQVDDNVRKVFNRVKITFYTGTSDVSVTKNESWDWGDSSSSFYYGVHSFDYNNKLINSGFVALAIANSIYDEFVWPKQEIQFNAKFVPMLDVEDRVSITYQTRRFEGGYIWGVNLWNQSFWSKREGYNILLNSTTARIIRIQHNLNNMTSRLVTRDVD